MARNRLKRHEHAPPTAATRVSRPSRAPTPTATSARAMTHADHRWPPRPGARAGRRSGWCGRPRPAGRGSRRGRRPEEVGVGQLLQSGEEEGARRGRAGAAAGTTRRRSTRRGPGAAHMSDPDPASVRGRLRRPCGWLRACDATRSRSSGLTHTGGPIPVAPGRSPVDHDRLHARRARGLTLRAVDQTVTDRGARRPGGRSTAPTRPCGSCCGSPTSVPRARVGHPPDLRGLDPPVGHPLPAQLHRAADPAAAAGSGQGSGPDHLGFPSACWPSPSTSSGIRRFWLADHHQKWLFSALYAVVGAMVFTLLVVDIVDLVG